MTTASLGGVLRERDRETELLAQALDAALAGSGRAVLVEGPPGIGKTSLLQDVCERAAGRARVLRARGGEQERDLPLIVTRELFAPLVRQGSEEDLRRFFAGAAELAGPLLGRGSAPATTVDSGFALVHGLYWLTANLADESPVVLAVDDVHWVDESSQRWLAYLLPRVSELPVLLAMTARPRELAPSSPIALAIAEAHDVALVRPGPLSGPASAGVVSALLPDAAEEFCAAAHRSTHGNPLLLRTLAVATRDAGVAPTAESARRLDRIGAVELGRMVLPRLHRLGPETVSLARAVAVLGDGCELVHAAELAGFEASAARLALDALVAADLLVVSGGSPAYTHPLHRAVVLEDLPPGATGELRARAAELLHAHRVDAEEVARHLVATDPLPAAWATEALQQAAALATGRGAPEAALTYLVAALRLDLDQPARFHVLLDAGWQAFRCQDPRGRAWLEEALDLAPDPVSAVLAWLAVWNWRVVLMDGHDPATVLDGLPEELGGDLAYAVGAHFLFDYGFTGADLRGLLPRVRIPDATPAGATTFERMWLCARGLDEVMTCGSSAEALRCVERAVEGGGLLEATPDSPYTAWAGITLVFAGEPAAGVTLFDQAFHDARRRGSRFPSAWNQGGLALGLLASGRIAEAEAAMFGALEQPGHLDAETADSVQAAVVRPTWVALVTDLHRQRDRLDAAVAVLGGARMLNGAPPEHWHGAVLAERRGWLRRDLGQVDAALAEHLLCRDVLVALGTPASVATPWRGNAAECLVMLGRRSEARELAEAQLEDARRFAARPFLGLSLRHLAGATGGAEGEALLEEALAVLEGAGADGERSRALLALGRLLRQDRRPAAARDPLQRALDLAQRHGATLLVRQTEEELRLTGARPRRRAVTGVDALTPAERRVATLAAQGMTNQEIAQFLFVTRKTVEKHLGSAFPKLGIGGRADLPAVLLP